MQIIKYFILIAISIFIFSNNIQAQEEESKKNKNDLIFQKGQLDLNIGIGAIPIEITAYRPWRIDAPSVSIDYGISDRISLGATGLIYQSIRQNRRTKIKTHSKNAIVGIRAAAHLNKYRYWDVYGGIFIGTAIAYEQTILDTDSEISTTIALHDKMIYSPVLGWKYRPQDSRIGGFIEIGFNGRSFTQIGVNIKL